MTAKTILVTGATGATGAYTVSLLKDRGHHVRALVHQDDARAAALIQRGVDVRIGDLLDLECVTAALQGVDTAYFVFPIEPGLVEATAYFAQAGRDAGLRAVVNMSQISARRDATSNAARQHWISERIFDWSGIASTHIRPTFFAEWLTMFADSISQDGVLALPFCQGRHAPIAAEDQAHVIAAILEDPGPHAGQIYPLFGPVEDDHHGIVAEVARTLGRPVRYEPIEIDEFRNRMIQSRNAAPHIVQHIENVAVDYRQGKFAGTNDIVERIGRTTPTTVAAFMDKRRAKFDSAPN